MSVVGEPPGTDSTPGSGHRRQLLGEGTRPHDPLQGARGGRLALAEDEVKNPPERTNPAAGPVVSDWQGDQPGVPF
jgi:hypothetical protein